MELASLTLSLNTDAGCLSNGIKHLTLIDIDDINSQLADYELVSLVFLLYDNEHVALERLIVAIHNQFQSNELLIEWTRAVKTEDSNWTNKILEALTIVQNYLILHQLGYEKHNIDSRFLPLNINVSLYITPLKKALYRFCESLNPSETKCLIEAIDEDCRILNLEPLDITIQTSEKYLECHFLKWSIIKYITISDKKKNDISNLVKLLIRNDHKQWADNLSKVENDFNLEISKNETSNSVNKTDTNSNVSIEPEMKHLKFAEGETKVMNYPMDFRNAGLCIIINQRNFFYDESNPKKFLMEKNLDDRYGTDVDCKSLYETWTSFGFQISIHENLKHNEFVEKITTDIANKFFPQYCCFVLCILSHGKSGAFFGSDSLPIHAIDIESCVFSQPVLLKKPKIFLYQACRGKKTQTFPQNVENNIVTDSPARIAHPAEVILFKSDFVICWATVEGFAALRNTIDGSWFVRSVCNALNENGDKWEFLELLRFVIFDVEKKRYKRNNCVVPEFRTAFGKHLYLQKKA